MPPALAVLLLWGLLARGRGCLQCEPAAQEALSQLRAALGPERFQHERLHARAQALMLGMEGPFFRDYALNAFVGKVGACWGGGGGEQGASPRGWGPRGSLRLVGETGHAPMTGGRGREDEGGRPRPQDGEGGPDAGGWRRQATPPGRRGRGRAQDGGGRPRPQGGEGGAGRWRMGKQATPPGRGAGAGRTKMGRSRGSLAFPPSLPPGIGDLELVASFLKNQTSHLMSSSLKGRSRETKPLPAPFPLLPAHGATTPPFDR